MNLIKKILILILVINQNDNAIDSFYKYVAMLFELLSSFQILASIFSLEREYKKNIELKMLHIPLNILNKYFLF